MGITVEEYEEIFSRMFGEEVLYDDVMDSKYLTIGKNDIIYREDSNGFWVNYEYGVNEYFFENSFGYWFKKMYDTNGNEIYYEDSDGEIIDNRNKSNINESIDYYDKLINILEPPYFRNLESMGIDEDHYETIFSKLFGQPVSLNNQGVFDSNGKEIYYENSDGFWEKTEYDDNGNEIYFENSDGYWDKRDYDDKGNEIYFENSNGYWKKYEYNENGDLIYDEDSDGTWGRFEYNDNGDKTLEEYSDGYWMRYEYDNNGVIKVTEDSDGVLIVY